MDTHAKTVRSQSFFTHFNLSWYDFVVGLVSPYVWRCPIDYLALRYAKYLSKNHLEVGPGTGFFLENAKFGDDDSRLVLMDLNHACLEESSKRLKHLNPQTIRQNILEPIEHRLEKFDSISLNYVLHCVPGSFKEKGIAFKHLSRLLNEGGVLFGCTVLGENVPKNLLAKAAMGFLQRSGIFNNQLDNLEDLKASLEANFKEVQIEMRGPTAVFSARK